MPISSSGKLLLKRNIPVTKSPQKHQRATVQPRQRANESESLPESPEIEKAVLGAILQNPKKGFSIFERGARKGFFLSPINRELFVQAKEFYSDNERVDMVGFTAHLGDSGRLKELGGAGYVTELFVAPSPIDLLDYYLDTLRDKYVRRQVITRSFSLASKAKGCDDVATLLDDWEAAVSDLKHAAGGPNGSEKFELKDLLAFDPKHDPNCLVGNRWLVRGGTSLWAGGSGYGKSSLEIQMAIYWACGVPAFGLRPVRPLKNLIVQAENDQGDTAEQFQGVIGGIESLGDLDIAASKELIEKNVGIHRVMGKTGPTFLSLLDTLIEIDRPDVIWIDPLFAFAGCDLLNPEKTGRFLREGLFPIAAKRGVCMNVLHHVGKPPRDAKNADSEMMDLDYQYLGFGTSEIQNAFRAVNILMPCKGTPGLFKLVLSKRGNRAGARDTEGDFTTHVFLRHSLDGICWLQHEKPEAKKKNAAGQFQASFDAKSLLDEMSVVHARSTVDLQKHVAEELGMSPATFYRLFAQVKKDGKVKRNGDEGWVKTGATLTVKDRDSSHGDSDKENEPEKMPF